MAEKNENGTPEVISTGASIAHTLRAAMKTGKAISGTAKGAAWGGPYGAVAGFFWANRKTAGKIVAALLVLLILSVIILTMLPGVIFDGYKDTFSEIDPEKPIMNSGRVVIENVNTMTYAINAILAEALEEVKEQIEEDFINSGASKKEIYNPYEGEIIYNINLFLSQYSAAYSEKIEQISIEFMEDILKNN